MIPIKISSYPNEKNCRCGSWFQHYKKFSFREITGCPAEGCGKIDIAGTHVQKTDSSDKAIYILPLCTEHSVSTEVLNILPSTKFVSANIVETCGEGFMTYTDSSAL